MTKRARPIPLAIVCVLALARLAAAGPLQDDLKARRARAMEKLGPDTVAIFWSAPVRVYSNDVNYEYRQDSNLLYLTGIDQEETILVLMPGNRTRREILFVREADARREHWNGHSLTPAEASVQSGIATVLTAGQFDAMIAGTLSGQPPPATLGGADEARTFFDALEQGKAKLALLLEPQRGLNDAPGPARQFATRMRERFFGFQVKDATPVLADLRQIKTPYEQAVLRKSALISSDAHKAGMRAAAAGKFEYEVEAAIEDVYLQNGAMSWGYPSIVGSGPNATVLHYEKSSRQMQPGDLLLVDAAANYQGQTVDITRTYPIDGRFSQAQRDIYEIVFAAQEAGIKAARIGGRAQDIQNACDEVLRAGLVKLGLVIEPAGTQFKIWATHGVSHWIGMDVHDVGARTRPLAPGMAFTIEPGIYVREAALHDLPKTPENAAFIEKVRAAVQKYKDIGVRIEDSFLVTDKEVENLSAGVPRTLTDVERFLAAKGSK
jgi:Xaa-Pro aminopeptidase